MRMRPKRERWLRSLLLASNEVSRVEMEKIIMNTTNSARSTSKSQRPQWKLRLGVLSLACWNKRVEAGADNRDFLTFTIQRSFKAKQGDWKNTPSLRQRDLLPMARLLERAFDKASHKAED